METSLSRSSLLCYYSGSTFRLGEHMETSLCRSFLCLCIGSAFVLSASYYNLTPFSSPPSLHTLPNTPITPHNPLHSTSLHITSPSSGSPKTILRLLASTLLVSLHHFSTLPPPHPSPMLLPITSFPSFHLSYAP